MTDQESIHPCLQSDDELLADCETRRTKGGGPGGQHRNKVETAIQLVHQPTGVAVFASERRSQRENLKNAIKRLRMQLAIEVRNVHSSIVEPSSLWKSRCVSGRIQCSDKHTDFPVMIAEAMDAIDAKEFDVKLAAAALGCSTSQLVRFVGRIPEALAQVNSEREQRGLRKLKS